ncbi:MAG: type VI secretion system tip protein VgrG, partial [Gammaproteobacteria bacterium]|nr:type VI secretion system tip protein VgrG [Gammaproteobacteria bacterium]
MKATQENREIEIITPLGKDVLLLQGFTVTEKLGRLFTLNAELLSVDDVVFEDILGQNVDIRVDLPEGKRVFNGYISSFSQDSHDGTYARYQATIHPWFWFLTRSSDCRIFQNKTVPEIIRKVCSDLGFTDISDKLSGEYRQWEYCVQYRETNFNFLSRLMEQEGIYYFFSHEKGKHTLNLCDCYSSHEALPDNKEIPYDPEQGAIANKEGSIHHWLVTKEIQSGMYALNEYDSTRPKMNEHVDSSIIQKHANADFELYDYPGEYVEPSDGRHYAKIRIEEQQTKYELLQGQSNVRGLLLGGLFS